MWIGPLLAVAFIVLGCQGSKEASSSAAPSATEDAPDTTAAAEPKAETAEPQAATEDSAESEPASDTPADDGALVAKVRGLTQISAVEQTDAGIQITFILEQAVTVNDKSTPQEVSDAMMFATFYTAPLLYGDLPEVDGLAHVFKYKKATIGTIKMTRASFESLNYDEAMAGVTDKAAKRPVYRKLLSGLPDGAVQIDKKYKP
ncbi:MAG: hypothetical protein JRH14_22815 [Deltaproteobacteria bacterium]|nr:hypothetical protein [Deltaproteobacteria bacterium]